MQKQIAKGKRYTQETINKASALAIIKRRQAELEAREKTEIYRKNPFLWVTERFGEDPKTIKWSLNEGYESHIWDGDKDPLLSAWKALANNKWAAVLSATGCHAKGQKILMYDGTIKNVEDVKEHDLLMGDDATPREVLALYRGNEKMYKVIPTKGDPFVVNQSHILSLEATSTRRGHEKTKNVSIKDYLHWNKTEKHIYKLYRRGVDFEQPKKLELDPYFAGIWLGDGQKKQPTICTPDIEIIEYLESFAKQHGARIKKYKEPSKADSYRICFDKHRNPIKDKLNSFVISGEKRIPQDYLTASRQDRLELLAGLVDSDGYVEKGVFIEIANQYKGLSDDILFLCRSLGFAAYKSIKKVKGYEQDYYRITISGELDSIPTKIKRKKLNKRGQKKNVLRTGFRLEELEEAEYFGFELDGNHLYLMGDFTVTHNTGKTWMLPRIICWFLDCWEDSLVVTSAPKEDQLKLLLWAEMAKCFPKFKKLRPDAMLGSLNLRLGKTKEERESWYAVGFTAGVSATEESTTKAQGFHRKDMLIILEETPGMPLPTLKAFENTSTGEHNLMFAVGNPDSKVDPLYQFSQSDNVETFRASAYDHPNIVCKRDVIPGATSIPSIERRKLKYGEDSPFYQSRVRGIAPAQGVDSLIRLEWVEEAKKKQVEPDGTSNSVGVDVANSAQGDMACLAWFNENRLLKLDAFKTNNASLIADKVKAQLGVYNVNEACIGVDAVGVGVSTINRFQELGMYNIVALQGRQWDEAIPLDKEEKPLYKFASLRCQMYWEAREDFRLGNISLDINEAEFEALKDELVVPKWYTRNGTIYIEPKEEIKKRLGHSTDRADAFVYGNFVRKRHRTTEYTSIEVLDFNNLDVII